MNTLFEEDRRNGLTHSNRPDENKEEELKVLQPLASELEMAETMGMSFDDDLYGMAPWIEAIHNYAGKQRAI